MTKRAGFTLLELLMALVLLALIGVGLASALQLGTQVYSRSQTLGVNAQEVAARAQLRRMLASATPPSLLTPFPKAFTGSETSLSFVTLTSLGFARHAAGIRVDLTQSGVKLSMTLTLFDDDGTTLETLPYELARGLNNLEIKYFAGDPEEGEWLEEWTDTARLPKLVSITADAGSNPFWPEFTVPLLYAN